MASMDKKGGVGMYKKWKIGHKVERIDFHDFLSGDYSENKKGPTSLYSLAGIPVTIRPEALLHPPDIILAGYVVVAAAGVFMIGCSFAERYLAKHDRGGAAEKASAIFGIIIKWGFIAGCIWAVYNNPLAHL